MISRLRLLPGTLLLLLGAVAVAISSRVLSTFLLDLVVGTISKDPAQAREPFEYSWGTMTWGRMSSDYSIVTVGFVLIAIGQCFVLPSTVGRIRSPLAPKPPMLPKMALIGASVLTVVAAASFLLIALISRNAFGVLATTGMADPVNLGEDLPVGSSRVFMIALVAAQLLMLVAAFAAPRDKAGGGHRGVTILAFGACACFALFAMGIVSNCLGPIRTLGDVLVSSGAADPAVLAGQISTGLNIMILASLVLGASAVLGLLAVLVPVRRGA